MKLSSPKSCRGFTLLEILLASLAASMILVAIYGIFSRAIKLRDTATRHTHEARLRARATKTVRDDLRSALISGGLLASTLVGSSTGSDGPGSAGFPGYLKFTTTTGKDGANEFYGDVQQVEYYVVPDPDAAANALHAGTLVRAINRDLLASVQLNPREEPILSGVQSLQVSFFDGSTWQTSWQVSSNTTTSGTAGSSSSDTGTTTSPTTASNLPEAIRVNIQQAASSSQGHAPPPLEILVPWTTQPFVPATVSPTATPPASASPSPTPNPPPPPPPPSP